MIVSGTVGAGIAFLEKKQSVPQTHDTKTFAQNTPQKVRKIVLPTDTRRTDTPAKMNESLNLYQKKIPSTRKIVSPVPKSTQSVQSDTQDIVSLFSTLMGKQKNTPAFTPYSADVFLNNGLSNTSATSIVKKEETQYQKNLRSYGNALGTQLQAFEAQHTDQISGVKAFLNDYSDTGALTLLGNDYIAFGEKIKHIANPVPSINDSVADAYIQVGEGLISITKGSTKDAAMVKKLLAYNKKAEAVATQYSTLVSLFATNNIVFDTFEPGSVFNVQQFSL